MHKLSHAVLKICLLALVVAGCSHGPDRFTPDASKWVPVKSFGVTMSLPPELKVVDYSSADPARLVSDVQSKYPNQPVLLQYVQEYLEKGKPKNKMIALTSCSNPHGAFDRFDLDVEEPTPTASLRGYTSGKRTLVRAFSDKMEKRTFPCGEAGFLEFHFNTRSKSATACGYTVFHGPYVYTFSFICPTRDKSSWLALAEEVMKTVRFTS